MNFALVEFRVAGGARTLLLDFLGTTYTLQRGSWILSHQLLVVTLEYIYTR